MIWGKETNKKEKTKGNKLMEKEKKGTRVRRKENIMRQGRIVEY